MNKLAWENAPEWANYLILDEDGEWCWFECKPKPAFSIGQWITEKGKRKPIELDAWYKTILEIENDKGLKDD